jgi:hypothetical protein
MTVRFKVTGGVWYSDLQYGAQGQPNWYRGSHISWTITNGSGFWRVQITLSDGGGGHVLQVADTSPTGSPTGDIDLTSYLDQFISDYGVNPTRIDFVWVPNTNVSMYWAFTGGASPYCIATIRCIKRADLPTITPIAGASVTLNGTVTTNASGYATFDCNLGTSYMYYADATGYQQAGTFPTGTLTGNYYGELQMYETGYVPPYNPTPIPVPPPFVPPTPPVPVPIPDPEPPAPYPPLPPFPPAPIPDDPLPDGWGICQLYICTFYVSGSVSVPISGATVIIDGQTLTSDVLGYSYINVYYELANGTYYNANITHPNYFPKGYSIKITDPVQILYVNMVPSLPAFTGTPLTGDTTITTAFTDTTGETPASWDWNYGDGSAHGTTHNPSHVYNDGTFSVTLTVTYASTGATTYSLTKTAYISVTKSITPTPTPTPVDKISGGNNPGDGTIIYQLNSSTSAEDPGSKYEHLMTLHSLTNYDLLDSPNYVLFPYTAINLTAKTITYASGTWVTNCYAGMMLMVTADSGTGVRCYGVVASNTGTVITMSTFMYETDIPATGFFIIHKGYNVDFMADISEPTAIENYDVNVDCFEFSDNDDKRKLSTRIVATGKDVFGKTISVMVDAPHAFDATRQFFNNSTVVRKRSEGYIYKNNFVATTERKSATVNPAATITITDVSSVLNKITWSGASSSFPIYSKVYIYQTGAGTLPSGIVENQKYYVVWSDSEHVEISPSISGSAMSLGTGWSGTCYMTTLGGLVIDNSDGTIVQNSQVVLYGTTAPVGLVIGSTYTNLTTSYTVNGYVMDLGVGIGTGASGDLEVAKLTNGGNFEELGSSPVVWLYGWQYTIPVGSEVAFSIPNSGIDGVPATTTALPQEFSAANNLLLTQVHLSAFPTTDFSGKGYLLNGRLYVGEKTPIGTNEVLIGEEKITVATVGTDPVYGDWIEFADVTKRVTSSTLKCYPHDVGALVARTNYTAASPEALSPIAEHGLIIDNRTVDGQITYGALDTYASSLLLGFGQFYQIATTWSPMIYGIVPHVGKVSDGTPESNRYRLIQAADRISFTKFSGETAVEYETVAITIICDEGRILLNLGDFEKNPYTTMIAGTNAINRPLS